jgi:cell division protein FtsW
MRPSAVRARQRPQPVFTSDLGRRHRPDSVLLILSAALLAIGLIVVYAIGPALGQANHVGSNYFVNKQLLAIGLSLVAFLVTSQVPIDLWRKAYKPLLVLAAFATLLALVMPVNPQYPAHRWVRLGTLSFQSVELLKFAVLIWFAGFLSNRIRQGQISNFIETFKPVLYALGGVAVVVAGIQSDLGSTGVIVAIMGTMAFVAGLPFKRILMFGGLITLLLFLAISSTPYRRARLETFLHPAANCQNAGYQACQALIAVGSGGMSGLGLGRSVQAYGYLPEAANDSIFAIYAEKFGFIGALVLVGLFVGFFSRLKSIAERITDDFSRLLVVGILAWLSVQTLINIGAMIGLIPLKGITLPFISYGGTSVVFVAMAVGLVFQISHYTSYSAPRITNDTGRGHDNRPNGRRLRGAYHPDSSGRARA